ncbi:hypothetical protein BH23ACT9_BH23ACT9_32270 [soil metagenome]
MLALLVEIDLHIPAARSLKDKRGVIRRLQARLRDDLGVSVAEVDHQDLWQRCTLGVAIATSDETTGRRVVQDVERIVSRVVEAEVLDIHIDLVQTEDRGFSMADPRIGVDGLVIDGFHIDLPIDDAGIPTGEQA